MSEATSSEAAMDMGAVDPAAAAAPQPAAPPPAAQQPMASSGLWHPSQTQKFDPRRKSPVLAAVLSVMPGVGQLYIGYYVRGFVIAAIFFTLILVAGNSREPEGPILAFSAMFIWVFNIIDAGRMAALYNHAAAGSDVLELPEDFKLPRMGGSIVGGAVLVVFGAIALSNTRFGYSLEWVDVWWPVFPLAIGAYLLARGIMDTMAAQSSSASSGGSKYDFDTEPSSDDD